MRQQWHPSPKNLRVGNNAARYWTHYNAYHIHHNVYCIHYNVYYIHYDAYYFSTRPQRTAEEVILLQVSVSLQCPIRRVALSIPISKSALYRHRRN